MNRTKPSPFNIIAGVIFGVYALLTLIPFSLGNFLVAAAAAFAAVTLFMKKRDLLAAIGIASVSAALLLRQIIIIITNLANGYHFDFLGFFLRFLFAAAVALAALFAFAAFTDLLPALKETAAKLWWLPAAVCGGIFLIDFISVDFNFFSYFIPILFAALLLPAGLLMYGFWIIKPEIPATEEIPCTQSSSDFSDCRMSLVKHTLLLVFTFGVWQYIWVFFTTRRLNRVEGLPYRNPVKKLLLSLFVPCYIVYWTYKTAQRLDKAATRKGLPGDMTVISTLFALFMPILSFIILQDRLNEIADA